MGKQWLTLFFWAPESLQMVIAAMKLKDAYSLEGKLWQPTPVLLPGESHGGKSLVGYSTWGRKESDTTDRLHFHFPGYSHTCVTSFPFPQKPFMADITYELLCLEY